MFVLTQIASKTFSNFFNWELIENRKSGVNPFLNGAFLYDLYKNEDIVNTYVYFITIAHLFSL